MTDLIRGRQGMGEPQRNMPDHGVSRGGPKATFVVHLVMHSIAEVEYEASSAEEALDMAIEDGWADADFDLDYSEAYACAPAGVTVPDWGQVHETWTPADPWPTDTP